MYTAPSVEGEYFLVGDESVMTKSGRETQGLDDFFSGLMNRIVKGIAIFSLSLVSVEERRSYPLRVEQVVRTEAEKEAAKARKKKQVKKDKAAPKKKRGRSKGSKNRDKTQVELAPELKRIQEMVKKQLAALQNLVMVRYLVLDGHFGNLQTCIYQVQMLHRDFAQALNVVIITKTDLMTGVFASVNLFSSDLELSYEKIIDFYSLRFQIEFNFRDDKQYWGLEDFMNVKAVPLTNAPNLSLFMVNLSQGLLRDFRQTYPESGVLDLKAYFRAATYFEKTIKMLPQKPEPILLEQIFGQVAPLGCIHAVNVHVSSP